MADVLATVSYTWVDKYGIPASTLFNIKVADSKTLAQIQTQIAADLTVTNALSQGVPISSTFSLRVLTEIDPSTAVGDVEKTALFNFDNGTDAYAYGVDIPDVNPSILDVNGLVDFTNADVTAFIDQLTSAGTAYSYTEEAGNPLTAARDALISFRKHRKQLSRKTKKLA